MKANLCLIKLVQAHSQTALDNQKLFLSILHKALSPFYRNTRFLRCTSKVSQVFTDSLEQLL